MIIIKAPVHSILPTIILFITATTSLLYRRCVSCAFTPVTLIQHTSIKTLGIARMSSSSTLLHDSKRKRLEASTKVIATHSGTFQADEALGVWLLRNTPTYYNSPVVRTRDPDIYNSADIVIDVGGTYNHDEKKYDHHQRDYNERFEPKVELLMGGQTDEIPRCTKLSASGLVYRHYGRDVIMSIYPTLSSEDLEKVYIKVYNQFMETIDAIDTGVEMLPSDVQMVYRDNTGLSSRISRLNARWNENNSGDEQDKRFEKAVAACGDDFTSIVTKIVESDLPARAIVEKAFLNRKEIDSSGEIVCLESGGLPWKGHLYNLEKEYNSDDDSLVKYVLYTDQSGMWRIQAVTVENQAFENRLSLPEEWRGVRDEDLTKVAGIQGCRFCHAAGFIGGNDTFEGVLEMAKIALKRK